MNFCPYCKENKSEFLFNKNDARKDKLDVYCIECRKKKTKEKQDNIMKERLLEQHIENEIWKDINEFDGYEVSTEGRIRNKNTCLLLKPNMDCKGYTVSSIRSKNIKFHRVIAQTFLPNVYNKSTIEHKDDNKMNNRLYNLKYATYKEQQQYVKEKKSRKSQTGVKIGTDNLTNIEGEIWKQVIEFPEYEISSNGRIKYPIRKGNPPYKFRITEGGTSGDGYKTFSVKNDNTSIRKGIHRIVADAFLQNLNNYKLVNHKDGRKTNNNVENLEWCTHSQNTLHAYNNDLISGKRKIYQLDCKNNIIKKWDTIKEASESLKLTGINNVLYGRNKFSGGFSWCYAENYNDSTTMITLYDTNKKKVKQIDITTNNILKIWDSISDISKYLSTKNNSSEKAIKSNISQCIRNLRNSCQGYKWEYLE